MSLILTFFFFERVTLFLYCLLFLWFYITVVCAFGMFWTRFILKRAVAKGCFGHNTLDNTVDLCYQSLSEGF